MIYREKNLQLIGNVKYSHTKNKIQRNLLFVYTLFLHEIFICEAQVDQIHRNASEKGD